MNPNSISPAADYEGRYPFLKERRGIWREIVRYVKRDVGAVGTLVELGAGYCDFINQYPAGRKIAFDLNPEMERFAHPDVDFRLQPADRTAELEDGSVDLFFASNFLEHLKRNELQSLLPVLLQKLSPTGRLVLLQPNYRLCASQYFVDDTHQTVFFDQMFPGFLSGFGFRVEKLVPDLLPFSMNSKLPKWPVLTRLFLMSPWRPIGAQMYAVAQRKVQDVER